MSAFGRKADAASSQLLSQVFVALLDQSNKFAVPTNLPVKREQTWWGAVAIISNAAVIVRFRGEWTLRWLPGVSANDPQRT